jgi:putative ABC transport system permease protein
MKYLLLIYKNIGRNLLRSLLTAMGTMVLVLVVTLVWSVLSFIDKATEEKSKDFKAIVTERWSAPSRMPYHYAAVLADGAARKDHPDDVRPSDWMTWQFFVGTLDKANQSFRNTLFGLACDPDKLLTMMDGLENLPSGQYAEMRVAVDRLKKTRDGIIIGRDHLKNLNAMIGNASDSTLQNPIGRRFKLSGISTFTGLDYEFEIVGLFPTGRYDNFTAFNREYLQAGMDAYKVAHNGQKHPLDDVSLGLVWLKVPDVASYHRIVEQIGASNYLKNPEVKIEMASSAIGTFMEAYRSLLDGMRWLLAPACIFTLALVLANAISISVRERRTELAVMKVLGFRPGQIVLLVLGESVLLGLLAGLVSAGATYAIIDWGLGGLKFPIAFFDTFMIPINSLYWGAAVGAGAALVGSAVPAWFACQVKPAEVFAKVG